MRNHTIFVIIFIALMLLVGCGSTDKQIQITGKIVLPSSVKLVQTDSISVDFIPEIASVNGGAATEAKSSDLSFSLNAKPGKYKVTVAIKPYPGEKDSPKRAREISQVIGVYSNKSSSLSYDVTNTPVQNVTIDLSKGSIQKN